jgi:hypothetical protein
MLLAIIITLIIVSALIYAFQGGRRRDGLIVHRPYNNPYSDASAAREDHLG